MTKFESINDSLFQKLEANEMSNLKGGRRLWHTFITGKTKHTSSSTGTTYKDSMEDGEEVINWGS